MSKWYVIGFNMVIRVCWKWFQFYIMLVKVSMLFLQKNKNSGRCEYVFLHGHSWVKTIQCTLHGTGQGVYIFETITDQVYEIPYYTAFSLTSV